MKHAPVYSSDWKPYSKAYNDFAEDMTCDMHNNFDID